MTLTYFRGIIVLKMRRCIFEKMQKGFFMSEIGIVKEFDKLGRLVIPKDLRERYGLFFCGVCEKMTRNRLQKKDSNSVGFH